MKILRLGLGVLAITAVVVAGIVANAASGDAVYARRDAHRYPLPVGPARTAVASLITECYPSLGINTFRTLRCSRLGAAGPGLVSVAPDWLCIGEQFVASISDTARLDLVLAGKGADIVSGDASVSLDACRPSAATVETLTQAVFTRAQDTVGEFACERGGGNPSCQDVQIVSAAPATWRADLQAGLVVGTIGKVQ